MSPASPIAPTHSVFGIRGQQCALFFCGCRERRPQRSGVLLQSPPPPPPSDVTGSPLWVPSSVRAGAIRSSPSTTALSGRVASRVEARLRHSDGRRMRGQLRGGGCPMQTTSRLQSGLDSGVPTPSRAVVRPGGPVWPSGYAQRAGGWPFPRPRPLWQMPQGAAPRTGSVW